MKIVMNPSKSAYFNLACEEYLARQYKEDMFMIWGSVPSILIGKNQNTYSEINVPYVEAHSIPVVRRMSGGGTIFCDEGNRNFTFIESGASGFADFKRFTQPILGYLNTLDVPAKFSGRNDLVIEDKKFSGNAQYKIRGRVVHHGSLLIDASLSDLSNALTPKKEKFIGKSIKSVAARVTNIFAHMPKEAMTVDAFAEGLYAYMTSYIDGATIYHLTDEDVKEIESLVASKYATFEWNYGHSPKYKYNHVKKYKGGIVEVHLEVEKGLITNLKINGDFFGKEPLLELENKLIDEAHEVHVLERLLVEIDLNKYIEGVSSYELATLLCDM